MRVSYENEMKANRKPAEESFPLPLFGSAAKGTVLWAIAGFDPSNGAGVTADLMTFAAHGLFGCSAITALTVQSTIGVFGWEAVNPKLFRATLERLGDDLPFAGLKIGMLGTPEIAGAIGSYLQQQRSFPESEQRTTVMDPVLRSSSGRWLFPEEQVGSLHTNLLPFVDWITPNWAELAALSETRVETLAEAAKAAQALQRRHRHLRVVATGGDQTSPHDLFCDLDGSSAELRGQRVDTTSTHGTGCAFSSALLCALVCGAEPLQAVKQAKSFVERALQAAPGLGHGRGPMGLLWPLQQAVHDKGSGC